MSDDLSPASAADNLPAPPPEVVEIKTNFMRIRRRLMGCSDPVETAQVIGELRAETGLSMETLKRCWKECEREKRERAKEAGRERSGKQKRRQDAEGPEVLGGRNRKASDLPLKINEKERPFPIVYNAITVLSGDPRWEGVLAFDRFSMRVVLLDAPPYADADGWMQRELCDTDDVRMAAWLQQHYDLHVPPGTARDAANAVSEIHSFNPLVDYLGALIWDGTARIDHWLADFFGVEKTVYTTAVASKTLIAAVARALSPGCKVDTVTVLEGDQGNLKSTCWSILAGADWFSDSVPDLHSKDAMQGLAGKWIVELAELSALGKSEIEGAKRFISSQQDHFRPSYGHRTVTRPRTCIFVGSTNSDRYLQDVTGNRRFWPIKIQHRLDAPALAAVRDQLWAEAAARYRAGEKWYLNGDSEQIESEIEQEKRVEVDDWEAPILKWLENTAADRVTGGLLFEGALGMRDLSLWTLAASRRVSSIMRKNGWRRMSFRDESGGVVKGYKKE